MTVKQVSIAGAMGMLMLATIAGLGAGGPARVVGVFAGTNSTWRQGPAIALPYTVASVGPLRLVLHGRRLASLGRVAYSYSLECGGRGVARLVQVSDGQAGHAQTVLVSLPTVSCHAARQLTVGTLPQVATLRTGDAWVIGLSAQVVPIPTHPTLARADRVFVMGTDGQLRAGLGSVWR